MPRLSRALASRSGVEIGCGEMDGSLRALHCVCGYVFQEGVL